MYIYTKQTHIQKDLNNVREKRGRCVSPVYEKSVENSVTTI